MGNERNGLIAANRQEHVFLLPGMKLSSFQTETTIGENTYSISRSGDKCNQFKVQIFIRKSGTWVAPAVLGEAPFFLKGHFARLVDKDRIMVVLIGVSINEGIWFLEVDTPYVREQKKILGTEVVAWSKGVPGPCPKPVVIAGPSGVGKGTLIGKLMEEFPSMFGFSVSHTTRLPREKEKDGIHYHFTDRSLMEKDIKDGKFLEFASVHGNLYGTSIEAVEAVTDAGKRCILDIDVQGSRSVRASSLEAVFIFISPPSYKELEKRLRGRGTESEEQIQKRLRNAITEIEQGKSPGLFDHILVNDNLNECYKKLKKILGLEASMDIFYHNNNYTNKKLICNLISVTDHEFTLQCDNSLCSLNVSLLQGGAPGRTRALQISTCLT